MKLQTIINSQESLKKLLEIKLPIKISYKISKIVNLCQPELAIFEEQRNSLIKKLGVSTNNPDNPNEIQVKNENLPEFQEDYNKLVDIDVDLGFGKGNDLEKIKIDDLGDIVVEPNLLLSLDWLFE